VKTDGCGYRADDPIVNMELTNRLKTATLQEGADLVGIADIELLKKEPNPMPAGTLDRFQCAISVAVHLDDAIVDTIRGGPTPEYVQHYKDINLRLDELVLRIAPRIEEWGYSAMPIPPSKIEDTVKLLGSIPHRAVAHLAGIGWQGKSLLLISPQFGPRIRLATVFTSMHLVSDKPIANRCGHCTECFNACPVSAIKNVSTRDHYQNRDEAIDLKRCAEQNFKFRADPKIGAATCGVCVQACPFGKPKRASRSH
jgi:epoxyqueuosine reductase